MHGIFWNDFVLDDILVFHFDFRSKWSITKLKLFIISWKNKGCHDGLTVNNNNTLIWQATCPLVYGRVCHFLFICMTYFCCLIILPVFFFQVFLSKTFFLFSKCNPASQETGKIVERLRQISIQYFSKWYDETIQMSRVLLCINNAHQLYFCLLRGKTCLLDRENDGKDH